MAGYRIPLGRTHQLNSSSAVLSGCQLRVCQNNTTTPVTLYSDRACTSTAANPIIADSAGQFPTRYVNSTALLRLTCDESGGDFSSPIWDDNDQAPLAEAASTTQVADAIASSTTLVAAAADDLEVRITRDARTTTSESIAATDRGQHLTFSNASAVAVSLVQAGATTTKQDWYCIAENIGDGVVTITPTTSTINGAATLTLRKGQWALITSDGTNYRALLGGVSPGRQHIFIPAGAMVSPATNGALVETIALGNGINFSGLSFDQTTQEFGCFDWVMPPSWDRGTVTFQPVCYPRGSSGGWVFALQAVAVSDDDALNASYGTEQTSTDSFTTAGDLNIGPESAAITVSGTPARDDLICFRIKRVPADGSDTHNGDVTLKGVNLYYNSNAANDL